MMINNLEETTCMVRYPCIVQIIYDQGGELLSQMSKKIFIEL